MYLSNNGAKYQIKPTTTPNTAQNTDIRKNPDISYTNSVSSHRSMHEHDRS